MADGNNQTSRNQQNYSDQQRGHRGGYDYEPGGERSWRDYRSDDDFHRDRWSQGSGGYYRDDDRYSGSGGMGGERGQGFGGQGRDQSFGAYGGGSGYGTGSSGRYDRSSSYGSGGGSGRYGGMGGDRYGSSYGGRPGSGSYGSSYGESYGPPIGYWGGNYESGRYDNDRYNNDRGFFERAGDEVRSWFGDSDAQRRREQDEHRGRGPKNYTRSDERIREDVSDHLSDDGSLDASDIEVKVSDGEVTLDGHVSSRMDKRRAEDCAYRVSGINHVQNNLRVKERDWSASRSGASRSGETSSLSTSTSRTGKSELSNGS
ncbi:BON domain-containing protein [Allopontixanthobacter sp.]|uniref:BON domain-containing protein n=1 Tax=Allopontixanthobacter sp. TaxID=2906452 RepID=UPI002ABB5ED7|nr:BON domain-containing protein [Allopontixanthobacter sp.]MDZ4308117.1 BON domain-containing protein [Allopontixanthobacter sp.]